MTKPSALTAALNGALNGATVVPTLPSPKPPLPRPSIKALADDYAFPCLAFATEDGQPRTGVEAGEEGAEPSRITIVGSAPTSTSAGDTTLVRLPVDQPSASELQLPPPGTSVKPALAPQPAAKYSESLLPNVLCASPQVDFPLSPYRRRSGKEAMPGA